MGDTLTLTATASGTGPLSYQWQANGTNLTAGGRFSGVTSNALTIAGVQGRDAGSYAVIVTNMTGAVTSSPAALLTVLVPLQITAQPLDQAVFTGFDAIFNITAEGAAPLFYQWSWNQTNLAGATAASLTLTNVQVRQAGSYSVVVSNMTGQVTSSNAVLTVRQPTNPRFLSESILAGGQIQFLITGNTNSQIELSVSTNLVDWTRLATLTNTTGTVLFSDGLTNTRRFYRARLTQ
jgi:hypothetical protein